MSDFSNARFNSIGTQSIPKLILQFSVHSIISMSVESLYNVVDRFFVAEEVGYLGITGITLVFLFHFLLWPCPF
jgi:Na+-driven multidrug efflux pump